MQAEIIICACNSAEHQLIIHKDDEFSEGYKEVMVQVHLTTYRNVFKRIWVALKYICGYKSKYGNWDCIILNKDNYKPLKEGIEFLEK